MHEKPATALTDRGWIIESTGFALVEQWQKQQGKRDQDNFVMHTYTDFSGCDTTYVSRTRYAVFSGGLDRALEVWC